MNHEIIPVERIENKILIIRAQKVILDTDLAMLYGIPTKVLNQAVKRNLARFPTDFMFQLTPDEKTKVVTICDHLSILKYSATLPYAFTEHGMIMVASVLNSPQAIETSVFVVRAFVKLREVLSTHKELANKLAALERKLGTRDIEIQSIMKAIRQLMASPKSKKREIGFHAKKKR